MVLAAVFALGGCTMDQIREAVLPGDDKAAVEKAAPPPVTPQTAEGKGGKETEVSPAGNDVAALPPGNVTPAPKVESVILTPPPGVERVIKVGLLLPLSGPHAALGQSLLNASQLALFGIAGENLALLPVDTEGTAEGAAAAARRALGDGARLILGPVFSHSVAAVAPVARSSGVQVVSFSNDRAVAGNGVYVMGFAPETQIRRVLTYARDQGLRRLAALVPDGPYGDRVVQTLRSLTPTLGIEMKAVARYWGQSTDALAPVVKRLANYDERRAVLLARRKELKAQNDEASKRALRRLEKLDTLGDVDFDGVFLPQGGPGLRALAPLLRFYDVDPRKVRVLGTVDWNDPVLATEPALYGGWFAAPPPAAQQGFVTAYKKTFGHPAPMIASLAYDATALAAVIARPPAPATAELAAATDAGQPVPALPQPKLPGEVFTQQALTQANGFAGADGIFRLLPSGVVERRYAVMEVQARRFVVVSPAPTTFQ